MFLGKGMDQEKGIRRVPQVLATYADRKVTVAIDINSVLFLVAARTMGVKFDQVLMIGRQSLNVHPLTVRKTLMAAGIPTGAFDAASKDTGFADFVFTALGAQQVSSIDASEFEGAHYVHDMNSPIPGDMKERFDLVYDGGTLEHIFNVPVALKNCMEMVKVGGVFVSDTCANNWCGHGFYQFSPEFFYRVLTDENGYQMERLVVHTVGPYGRWYQVADPRKLGSRIEVVNFLPLQMLVMASRQRIAPVFAQSPQQSDYVRRWRSTAVSLVSPHVRTTTVTLPIASRLLNVIREGCRLISTCTLANRRHFRPISKRPSRIEKPVRHRA